jgi:hypothetical protein
VIARLRSQRIRTNLLPFVLAALALRAFMPLGFMPGATGGFSFSIAMCSPTSGASEVFALPGEAAKQPAAVHCDFCGGPVLAGLPVLPRVLAPTQIATLRASFAPSVAFIATLERAQSARAPPIYI